MQARVSQPPGLLLLRRVEDEHLVGIAKLLNKAIRRSIAGKAKAGVQLFQAVFLPHLASGILHNHRANAFAGVFAGIGTGLHAIENLPPGDGFQHVPMLLG